VKDDGGVDEEGKEGSAVVSIRIFVIKGAKESGRPYKSTRKMIHETVVL
jgi:hypothetical protein